MAEWGLIFLARHLFPAAVDGASRRQPWHSTANCSFHQEVRFWARQRRKNCATGGHPRCRSDAPRSIPPFESTLRIGTTSTWCSWRGSGIGTRTGPSHWCFAEPPAPSSVEAWMSSVLPYSPFTVQNGSVRQELFATRSGIWSPKPTRFAISCAAGSHQMKGNGVPQVGCPASRRLFYTSS